MAAKRVLVVEDEQKVAEFIKNGLEENNYEVDVAFDGFIGQRMFTSNSYFLILLDINLPQINGYELCKFIRKKNHNVAIIMLTAMGSTEDKIAGFDYGADDYLVKPFEFRELLARIKSLEKRSHMPISSKEVLTLADLEVNLESKIVRRAGKKIDLTNKEYQLLVFLMENKNKVITRNDIATKIWSISFERGTNVIDVYVNFLRKKIDRGHPNKLIHTQIGMGYIMRSDLEVE